MRSGRIRETTGDCGARHLRLASEPQAIACLAVLVSVLSVDGALSADWPAFRGDPDHTGVTDELLSIFSLDCPVGTITLHQQCDADGAADRHMYGVAAVPEPATVVFLMLGAAALRGRCRIRRRNAGR